MQELDRLMRKALKNMFNSSIKISMSSYILNNDVEYWEKQYLKFKLIESINNVEYWDFFCIFFVYRTNPPIGFGKFQKVNLIIERYNKNIIILDTAQISVNESKYIMRLKQIFPDFSVRWLHPKMNDEIIQSWSAYNIYGSINCEIIQLDLLLNLYHNHSFSDFLLYGVRNVLCKLMNIQKNKISKFNNYKKTPKKLYRCFENCRNVMSNSYRNWTNLTYAKSFEE